MGDSKSSVITRNEALDTCVIKNKKKKKKKKTPFYAKILAIHMELHIFHLRVLISEA
jgi:hypothetical protein